jgi:hypothetical protein
LAALFPLARRAAILAALALVGGCAVFRVTPAALQAGTIGDVTVRSSAHDPAGSGSKAHATRTLNR